MKRQGNPMRYVYAFLATSGLVILAGAAVYAWFPAYRTYLVAEDSLVENLTAISFLCTFLLGLIFLLRTRNMDRKGNSFKWFILLSALGLLGFLEELSFGERLFDMSMPVLSGWKIDALHDFLYVGYRIMKRHVNMHHLIFFVLLSCAGMGFLAANTRYRVKLRQAALALINRPPYLFLLFFLVFISVAAMIDLKIIPNRPRRLFEELFELNAALATLFCCFSIVRERLAEEHPVQGA